jgi:hypothetical protein
MSKLHVDGGGGVTPGGGLITVPVQVTVVEPMGKKAPGGGEQTTEQLLGLGGV